MVSSLAPLAINLCNAFLLLPYLLLLLVVQQLLYLLCLKFRSFILGVTKIYSKLYIMNNRLTYKKVYVDSAYRLRSSSDFVIELNENFECPAGTKCWITEVSLPTTWKSTEVGFFENLYFMLYNDSYLLLSSSKVYLF